MSKSLKNYILVAEIDSRRVLSIEEGPHERSLLAKQRRALDETVALHVSKLRELFPPVKYDIIPTRAADVTHLKSGYPELSGWDGAVREELTVPWVS